MRSPPLLAHAAQVSRRSSALLISLLMLSLITIIAVAFLGTMTWELSASRRDYDNQRAQALAMLGMNSAMAQVRSALGTWDNPYSNFATNPPSFFWSMSPGIITRWSYSSSSPQSNYPLFSIGSTNLFNLNAAAEDGSYPIAGIGNSTTGSGSAPNISVYWVNVLKTPGNVTAGSSNPLIGRYAFWVDDESAKVNINTADGTLKYTTNSLGLGSPSEISLQALQDNTNALSPATNVVYIARTLGFNSPQEILRATNAASDLYSNNVFNITTCSRSPDLNIFGQPKMALMPIQGAALKTATDMTTNGITLRPPVEIYPTPSQLPPYLVVNPVNVKVSPSLWYPSTPATATSEPWPLAFRGQLGLAQNGNVNVGVAANGPAATYIQNNYFWINGMMLADYLAGINAAGKSINWPPFPSSSTTGFSGKYSNRQIDSIVAQIISLGGKAISPDRPATTDASSDNPVFEGRSTTTPPLLFGWLSHQWVSGMGRGPKVDAMELGFSTYGSVTNTVTGSYTPPEAQLYILQEWWMPANYLGVLNAGDLCGNTAPDAGTTNVVPAAPTYYWPPAPLPKLPDSSGSTNSYWGDQLLANNQGIDFQANPDTRYDPDQVLAALYHNPYALTNGNYYGGTTSVSGNGTTFATPLELNAPQGQSPAQLQAAAPNGDWAPGELRVISSNFGNVTSMDMQTTADSSTLTISGGIQVRTELVGQELSDMDPTPLESIRGLAPNNGTTATELFDNESWSGNNELLGSPGGTTVRDRNIASVISVACSMPIPAGQVSSGGTSDLGDVEYVLATVADPLVNKFPGDWTNTTSGSPFSVASYWPSLDPTGNHSTTVATSSSATEFSSGFHNTVSRGSATTTIGPDPNSYWMPQEDVPICYLTNLPSQTLIPRSARFPNIGYLQYVRTGIIPDDETQPYAQQHGTPFRLLNFAPSSDSSQQTTLSTSQAYPDWAMLDLLYIPSLLSSYRSPYGYYDVTGTWTGYGTPSVLANFSTCGGSTPGRLNPNGAVIYTTNVSIPQPGVARTVPLEALLQGIWVNQTNNVSTSPTAGYSGGSLVDASTNEGDASSIPVAIEQFLRTNGPLSMPAELCNVPAIAALRPSINPTRNDLIRQAVGALTTQSNTFSVWVAGQALAKSKANTSSLSSTDPEWGLYQSGDQILSTVRYHFIVERYLDPGADGVYGNSINPGGDGVVGTYDDPVDPINHPFQPRYLYRVIYSEEIR
jgi:hypothetical protein